MSNVDARPILMHRSRRGAELFLLLISLAVGIGAYALVALGVEGEFPTDLIGYGGWLVALILACHVTVRIKASYADPILLPVVACLNGLGLAMIHRIDLLMDSDAAGSQLLWTGVGVAAAAAVLLLLRDHRALRKVTYISLVASALLLILPLLLAGAQLSTPAFDELQTSTPARMALWQQICAHEHDFYPDGGRSGHGLHH